MDHDALIASLQRVLPGVAFEASASIDRQATVYIDRDQLHDVALALRDHPDLAFAFLAELTAIDVWPREPRFELVYMLVSFVHKRRLRLKMRLAGGDAHVATVTDIWPAANWLEREVWDMFGIAFDGHPDPRRLLMPEDWQGFPLRKDYPVQIRKSANSVEPLQVTQEEFRRSLEKDRLSRQ
jgi:NADH-quinone oxidoreductase subunit C